MIEFADTLQDILVALKEDERCAKPEWLPTQHVRVKIYLSVEVHLGAVVAEEAESWCVHDLGECYFSVDGLKWQQQHQVDEKVHHLFDVGLVFKSVVFPGKVHQVGEGANSKQDHGVVDDSAAELLHVVFEVEGFIVAYGILILFQ